MHCPKCGCEINYIAKFCADCGTPLNSESATLNVQ